MSAEDKSAEAYAKRLQQLIKNHGKTTDVLYAVTKEKQEEVLALILDQRDWINQLSFSETDKLLKTAKSVLGNLEYAQYFPKAELLAKTSLLFWEHNQNRHPTILQDLDRQPPHVQKAILELLAQAAQDETYTPQRREAYREALEIREIMSKREEKASESAENWIEYFLEVLKTKRDWHATKKLPKIPEGGHSKIVKQLIELEDKYKDKEAIAADGITGPWKSSFGDAFDIALAGKLDDETEKLFLERQIAPLYYLNAYDSRSKEARRLIKAAYESGESPIKNQLLATIRRTAVMSHGYADAAADKWALEILQPELNPGEAWSDAFLARLDALPAAQRQHWPALVAFVRTATTAKPSDKWLKEGQKHIDAVSAETFRAVLTASLPLLSKARTFALAEDSHYNGNPNLMLDSFNAQSLKGLLWLSPLVADSALARAAAGVVDSALKKVPGIGPREPKIANAAVYALSRMESDVALSALARLSTTVTYKGTLKEVGKALAAVAERLNTSPEDLLELGVPTLGLQTVGERVEQLGDVEARLTVGADGAKLTFSKEGKALKSVPASVKKDFAEELKELKTAQKEAEGSVSALAQRLDSLMIQEKVWRGDVWQERYLNHPLAGTVARRLIWLLDGVPAFWSEGKLLTLAPCGSDQAPYGCCSGQDRGPAEGRGEGEMRSVNDHALNLNPDSEVKLWHPISQPVDEVLAWRDRLEQLGVKQPFKQAWREVYLLTDAERRTGTYSNRFAGHILKQHQFNQLAALRGWRNKLRLMVDDSYPPAMRDLPQYGLRVEYWIEGIGDDYGADTTESGTYLRVVTDQLRFYPIDAPENHAHAGGGGYEMWVSPTQRPVDPLPLEQIPPLVLSEIMRDVDLFVGVASVGNDPTWQDGGPGGRFREYWQSYSFGELNETAKTRSEYLTRLIPRLKIKDRLSIDGRFLLVKGDRRSYKIHLGSGNILMTPNDQYLCIIPGGKSDGPALDFDGDRVLSLILSKAFLLADDTKITDPVILQQLGR